MAVGDIFFRKIVDSDRLLRAAFAPLRNMLRNGFFFLRALAIETPVW
jgi:hypothetical protein